LAYGAQQAFGQCVALGSIGPTLIDLGITQALQSLLNRVVEPTRRRDLADKQAQALTTREWR
jgi:hypothetical protein